MPSQVIKKLEAFWGLETVDKVHHHIEDPVDSPNHDCHEYGSHHHNHGAIGEVSFGRPAHFMNEFIVAVLQIRK